MRRTRRGVRPIQSWLCGRGDRLTAMTSSNGTRGPQFVQVGELHVDRERYVASWGGSSLQLTYLQFQVLFRIAKACGAVVRYEELESEIWGESSEQSRRRLAVLVSRIRSKLGPGAAQLVTVHRVGYRIAGETSA